MATKKRKFKFGINTFISWGATIVILGLMFKILHWPGGEWMIAIGLITEAILFFVLGFQAEEDDALDWTRVYPELDKDYTGDFSTKSSRNVEPKSTGNTAALDKMLQNAHITPESIHMLGDGLRSFGDKVQHISQVSDAAFATNQFTDKVKQASSGFERLSLAFEKASADLSTIGESSSGAKTYQEQVGKLSKNLEALNAVYELELQDSSKHLKAMNQHYGSIAQTLQNFNDSVEDTKQFKDQVNHLTKNLSSLNAVYGNMLAAMNQPRS